LRDAWAHNLLKLNNRLLRDAWAHNLLKLNKRLLKDAWANNLLKLNKQNPGTLCKKAPLKTNNTLIGGDDNYGNFQKFGKDKLGRVNLCRSETVR